MTENDLNRVKNDLDTLESAIGLRPWDPREVRINLLFALAGLVAVAWALVPHGLAPMLGFCSFAVPVAEWLRCLSPVATDDRFIWRDFQAALRTFSLLVPIAALFFWCRHVGLLPLQFLGLACFLVGILLFSAAVGERSQRVLLGWAAALMVGGLLLPLSIAPPVAVLAATLGLGGLTSAALSYAARKASNQYAAG